MTTMDRHKPHARIRARPRVFSGMVSVYKKCKQKIIKRNNGLWQIITHACENVHVGHMASRMACKVEANQPFIYPTTEHLNYALVVMLIGS